ncbi:MAG: bifunctional phosphoribosyl-AMP cyclohydrolase/phosphoribosyl-ATP diphosphatase HisIE [Pseudobdellovibrionaceae bacterium]|jgi:phosphoribosyl-ATP pyrophosphohydrolase/phosphoribosyl-AMP cyclohydrolase|nr:bifunctional phosphoribosyl-AMP cyclohydrolase/phosphoribosyl-ATP diphosphatase HisIE [Pseudobdellovibrionaceae bacterium]
MEFDTINWQKVDGLVPVIVQDAVTRQVLMQGVMNREAFEKTQAEQRVTFYSRTKERLWTKGESSGHFLNVEAIYLDCDKDCILVLARPQGPTCHTGDVSCFHENRMPPLSFLGELAGIISARAKDMPEGSYTTSLFKDGKARIAQKVGEEGVEVALAVMQEDRHQITNEAADLIFHLMVALETSGVTFDDVCACLQSRHKK